MFIHKTRNEAFVKFALKGMAFLVKLQGLSHKCGRVLTLSQALQCSEQ